MTSLIGPSGRRDIEGIITNYDFYRPPKVSPEEIRTLEIITEKFAWLAQARLSALLRLPCALSLTGMSQMLFSEYQGSIPAQQCISLMNIGDCKRDTVNGLMRIDSHTREALIERLLAAPSGCELPEPGNLTDIESSVLEVPLKAIVSDLGKAWEMIPGFTTRFINLQTDMQSCQILPPTEILVLASCTLTIGPTVGTLDIVLPFISIEPFIRFLSASYWYSQARTKGSGIGLGVTRALNMPVRLFCGLGKLTVSQLRGLKRGSRIPLRSLRKGEAWLELGGERVADISDLHPRKGIWEGRIHTDTLISTEAKPSAPADPVTLLSEELRAGIASLKSGFEGSVENIEKQIAELRGGQDSLADQLMYGQADLAQAGAGRMSSLKGSNPESLAFVVGKERAQLSALLISFLKAEDGAKFLSLLPRELQSDVVRRLALLDWTSDQVLDSVERSLSLKLGAIETSNLGRGGIARVVEILNLSSRETEKSVVESLDKSDPVLSEGIKQAMFIFSDIAILEDGAIADIIATSDEADLLKAMKTCDAQLRERLFSLFPAARRESARASFEELGRLRLSDCDEAGRRIVDLIRHMEDEGRVEIFRSDD